MWVWAGLGGRFSQKTGKKAGKGRHGQEESLFFHQKILYERKSGAKGRVGVRNTLFFSKNRKKLGAPGHFHKSLVDKKLQNFDVRLEVYLQTKAGVETKICQSNFKNLYWTVAQQIAHHTVNGCNLNVGDLLASGTISGKDPNSFGSLLELTWGGKKPILLPDGTERRFLEDYDTIIIRGFAEKGNIRVDFGEVRNTVLPTK